MGNLSSDQLREVLDKAPVGLVLCRFNGENVYVNFAYADIIGYTREQTLALRYWDVTPRKYLAQEVELLKAIDTKGEYGPFFKHYIDQAGHLVPVRLQLRRFQWNGDPYIWTVVEELGQMARDRGKKSSNLPQQEIQKFAPGLYQRLFDEVPINLAVYLEDGTMLARNGEISGKSYRAGRARIDWDGQVARIEATRACPPNKIFVSGEEHAIRFTEEASSVLKTSTPLEHTRLQHSTAPAAQITATEKDDSAPLDGGEEIIEIDEPIPAERDPITREKGEELAAEVQRNSQR